MEPLWLTRQRIRKVGRDIAKTGDPHMEEEARKIVSRLGSKYSADKIKKAFSEFGDPFSLLCLKVLREMEEAR